MDLIETMRQAFIGLAPVLANQDKALDTAVAAGKVFLVNAGTVGKIIEANLRSVALVLWVLYVSEARRHEFVCAVVNRDDLIKIGATEKEALSFSDDDMIEIAQDIEEALAKSGFAWTLLSLAANRLRQKQGLSEIAFLPAPEGE